MNSMPQALQSGKIDLWQTNLASTEDLARLIGVMSHRIVG
jgi:hypothetical protein